MSKNLYLWVQGRSRSEHPESSSPVPVMISSKSVPVGNRLHARRVNSRKKRHFRRYPFLTPPFERNPVNSGKNLLTKNIAAKPLQMETWLGLLVLLTAYRKSPAPYQMVPSPTPYELPFSHNAAQLAYHRPFKVIQGQWVICHLKANMRLSISDK